jgi:hypothetical protein
MHREPTPKAQATILRQIFADNGVDLAHRKVLDFVARLHGHANWQVMSANTPEVAIPVPPPVSFNGTPMPLRRARAVAEGPLKCYQFDGIAYVDSRDAMEALEAISYKCTPELWAAVEKDALELGFTGLGSISIEEDEGQDDDDIKVFVSVELYGRSLLRENDSASEVLACILDRLAAPACTDAAGNVLAEPEDWEVLSIDSHLETVPAKRKSYVFEAAGFVATREQLKLLPSTGVGKSEGWAMVQAMLDTFGFDAVGNIDLCEEDGAGDTNIKVYLCVRLEGRSYLTPDMPLPGVLIQALGSLTESLCRLPDGSTGINVQPWELSVVEALQDPLMML